MNRRFRPWLVLAFLASAPAGCDYSSSRAPRIAPGGTTRDFEPVPIDPTASSPSSGGLARDDGEKKGAILVNVVNLIRTSALRPGGDNFEQAADNLNQFFEGTDPSAFGLRPETRAFLLARLPQKAANDIVRDLEAPKLTRRDARHIEDCMMYHGIATRVAGTGDDLTRVGRVFDWIVRQIQLVPAGTLGAPGLGHAYARPYDVLFRGMATEAEERGFWAERGWLFMSLCRQLGIDVGLVTYTPPGAKEPVAWLCAARIDGKLYLFDTRIGLAVPGPDGTGVATLDEALADPVVLDRLDLPGQSPYGTTRAALAASPSKIGIMIDSSPGYLSPRMRLLQRELSGKDSTILHRDPADQHDRFVEALGPRAGTVTLWPLPLMVDALLFSDPDFVRATQQAQILLEPRFPLLHARIMQLRGDFPAAIEEYMALGFVEKATLTDKKSPMPREVQAGLDVYSTYFLGLCHLDQDNPRQAEFFFRKTLSLLPEYGPGQPYFAMFRWGAEANLARLHEARGESGPAASYYAQRDLTTQHHGNLVRARDLTWRDPLAPTPAPLPPAPATFTADASSAPSGGH